METIKINETILDLECVLVQKTTLGNLIRIIRDYFVKCEIVDDDTILKDLNDIYQTLVKFSQGITENVNYELVSNTHLKNLLDLLTNEKNSHDLILIFKMIFRYFNNYNIKQKIDTYAKLYDLMIKELSICINFYRVIFYKYDNCVFSKDECTYDFEEKNSLMTLHMQRIYVYRFSKNIYHIATVILLLIK